MNNITVPQINANEDIYVIQELLIDEGKKLKKGDFLAVITSSKSVMELEAEYDGIIHWLKNAGDNVRVGEKIAVLYDSEVEYENNKVTDKTEKEHDFVLTDSAAKYAKENHIKADVIAAIGKKIIKKSDLERLLKAKGDNDLLIKLSPNQRGVSNTVTKSASEIPKAFQVNKIDCTKMETVIDEISKKIGVPIGYAEIMTWILFRLYDKFPVFYGKFNGEDEVILPETVSVGITMDCGNGLYVPSIKSEYAHNMEILAEKIFEYKINAMRGEFSSDQLTDSSISIALNNESGTIVVNPIIMPNQVAMCSIGAVQKELCMQEDGSIKEHNFIYLGLAYDHRVINGYQAMMFMGEVKQFIENANINFK